jgi:hypothetical protein
MKLSTWQSAQLMDDKSLPNEIHTRDSCHALGHVAGKQRPLDLGPGSIGRPSTDTTATASRTCRSAQAASVFLDSAEYSFPTTPPSSSAQNRDSVPPHAKLRIDIASAYTFDATVMPLQVLHWRAPWPASWSSVGSWWVSEAMTRSQQEVWY